MKLVGLKLAYIKSFKTLDWNIARTKVIIGQNDHGKSSILKILNFVLNEITDYHLDQGFLEPALAEKLIPAFSTSARARRITLIVQEKSKYKELYIDIGRNYSIKVHDKITRGAKTTPAGKKLFTKIRSKNRFELVPAIRDVSSEIYKQLFSTTLQQHGLSKLKPKAAGGTQREYRELLAIRNSIDEIIQPYVHKRLLPKLSDEFGFTPQHELLLTFNKDTEAIAEWIQSNLQLGFKLGKEAEEYISIDEAGTGIQSALLLALIRLKNRSEADKNVHFFLAIEEPETFLHPQKQKELYSSIKGLESDNLTIIITTHSPYIVSESKFSSLGIVRKDDKFSNLHTVKSVPPKDMDIFDSYSGEVNSQLFFADKVILVEGESDKRVIETILHRKFGAKSFRYTVISAAGNRNFSPYLKMINCWKELKIPHLVVTDFDSLTAGSDRAMNTGAKAAGYLLNAEQLLNQNVDDAIQKDEGEYRKIAIQAANFYARSGLEVFIWTCDLEYALISDSKIDPIVRELSAANNSSYSGYTCAQLRTLIGSKGIPLNSGSDALKKPYIHQKLSWHLDLDDTESDVYRLIQAINKL